MLKPSGALAAWCYWFPQIKHHEEANTILQKFREQVTGGPTTAVQRHAESRYKDLQPGPEEFGVVEWDSIPFVQESTVWHLVRAFLPKVPAQASCISHEHGLPVVGCRLNVSHEAACKGWPGMDPDSIHNC